MVVCIPWLGWQTFHEEKAVVLPGPSSPHADAEETGYVFYCVFAAGQFQIKASMAISGT